MKILTAIVSYNRLPLLQQTVESYQATITGPHKLLVVDNGSERETREWLEDSDLPCLFLAENRYPGYASNIGWTILLRNLRSPHLLHRSDNDVEYLPGWSAQVRKRFDEDPRLGQLGLRTGAEEGNAGAVGGNCVIRSVLFEQGFRYSEQTWREQPFEDAVLGGMLEAGGWRWDRVSEPCIVHRGIASSSDPYYQQTFRERGITFAAWGVP